MPLRDNQLHFLERSTQDFIREPGIGVDQTFFDRDRRLIGDAGQQFHVGFRTDTRMPADRDLLGRTDTRFDSGLFRGDFHGLCRQFGFQFHRLIGVGDG